MEEGEKKKKRFALSGKGNSVVLSFNNGDGLKEMACIRIVSMTDGWTVYNKAKRYFDEKGDGSDSSQIRIPGSPEKI